MAEPDLNFLRRRLAQLEAAAPKASDFEPMGLGGGGSGPHDPGMEPRVAKLESDVGHIMRDVSEIRTDIRDLRKAFETDFRLLFGALISVAIALAGVMAKGFHWL